MPGRTVGRAASRPEPPSTQIMSRPSPVRPRRNRSVRKRSHSAALSLAARRKSMISFLPSGRRPSATSTGRRTAPAPVLRASTTPSSISTLYWFLSGRRWKAATAPSSVLATRLTVVALISRPKHRQQRLADLAGRQSEHEAGQDDPVDLGLPAGIGAQHPGWTVAPGPRHAQFDVAERGQQMARVVPVAPVRDTVGLDLLKIAVDRH